MTNIIQYGNNIDQEFNLMSSYFTKDLTLQKYSPFSLEFKRIPLTTIVDYSQAFSINIPIIGNILYRGFFEIQLPVLNFTDTNIPQLANSAKYMEYRKQKLLNITNEINYWTTQSTNMNLYCNIMINGYVEAKKILILNNVTLTFLQSRMLTIYNSQQDNLYKYKLLIDSNIISSIDILSYILGLTTLNPTIVINTIDSMYNNIINYLNYYFMNSTYFQKKYNIVNTGKILTKWIDHIGHYYFNYFELEIDGFTIDNYSNDYLHIKQTSSIHVNNLDNYNKMIGNTDAIYINKGSPNYIYTPLLFSFSNVDESINALPLVGMSNSNIKINSSINNINNLIYLQDWEEMYNEILSIEITRRNHNIDNLTNTFSPIQLPYSTIDVLIPEYIYMYNCKYINKTVLDTKYPNIDSINILKYYGSFSDTYNETILTLDDWIYLMNNIKTETYLQENTKITLAGYHYFIDYNYVLNIIPKPTVSLLMEYGYIDNLEKKQMATANLEYLVETHHEIILNVDSNIFDDDLNNINGLVKDIYLLTRQLVLKNGISPYGKNNYTNFISSTKTIDSVILNISSEYDLLEYYNININSYNNIPPYYYLTAPIPSGIFYRTFSLDPKTIQPSGSVNMNTITGQNIQINVNDNNTLYYNNTKTNPNNLGTEIKIIYSTYNILKINNGMCNLLFYS